LSDSLWTRGNAAILIVGVAVSLFLAPTVAVAAGFDTTVTVGPGGVPVSLDSSSVAAIASAVASSIPAPATESTGVAPVMIVLDPGIASLLRVAALFASGAAGWFIGYRVVGGS